MRDVVVIGGGLSGLAAALELEIHGVSYTIIEVKPRLGGSLITEQREGFVLDSHVMLHDLSDVPTFEAYLRALGLEGGLFRQGSRFGFMDGGGALVGALAAKITAPILYRMVVSTLGQGDNNTFLICMENGMVLDARALIVAAPARFTERMFYTLTPEISFHLIDYRYDSIARVSLGYRAADIGRVPEHPPADYPITSLDQIAHAGRVPPGGVLVQVGVRFDPSPSKGIPPDVVGETAALFGWPLNPLVEHVAAWPEGDPIMWRDPDHPMEMHYIQHILPDGVALCGSDYIPTNRPPRLDERIAQGQHAARRVLAWIKR